MPLKCLKICFIALRYIEKGSWRNYISWKVELKTSKHKKIIRKLINHLFPSDDPPSPQHNHIKLVYTSGKSFRAYSYLTTLGWLPVTSKLANAFRVPFGCLTLNFFWPSECLVLPWLKCQTSSGNSIRNY